MDSETQERILELLDEDKSASEVVKILKDEGIKTSKGTVNRCRTLLTALGNNKKLTPFEREIYLSYMTRKKEEKKSKFHIIFSPLLRTVVDGPADPNMPEMIQGHQNFMNNYTPQNISEPINVDVNDNGKIMSEPTPFVAASKFGDDEPIQAPKFFWNPYTALDLMVFQDVYTHTICGTIIDVVVAFLVGMGIHPVLRCIVIHKILVSLYHLRHIWICWTINYSSQ